MTFIRWMSTKETTDVIFLNFGFRSVFDHFHLCLYLGLSNLSKYLNKKKEKKILPVLIALSAVV